MNSLKILIFAIFVSPILLIAEDIYVKVVQLKTNKNFSYVYSVLSRADMNMFVKKTRKDRSYIYTIYSGPYKSKPEQSRAITHAKKYFKDARLIRFKPKKLESESTSANGANKNIESFKYTEGFFIGLGGGYVSAPSSHVIDEGSVIVTIPDSKGASYKVAAGYSFDNGLMSSVNYLVLDTSDITLSNLYASLNYRFDDMEEFVPYFGASVGMSSLKWGISPIDDANSLSNNDSDSLLYGTQAGLIYQGFYPLSFSIEYNCMFMQHTANITQDTSNSSKLEHNSLHSAQFFIHYNF
jgi:hypothetical protein